LRRRLLIVRASARGELRELDAARDDIAAVLKGAEEAGDRASQAHALTVLGQIEQHESHLATSTATLDRAVHLWREIGDRRGEAGALRVLGMTALLQGENETAERAISEAIERAQEARRVFASIGDRWGELQAAGTLVRGLVAAGRLDEAFAAVETAHELLCSGTDDRNLRDIGRFVAVASAAQAGEPARWLEWASADEQFDSAPFVGQQQATLA